jgi:hypothetical protein
MGPAVKFDVPSIEDRDAQAWRKNVEELMHKIKHMAGWGRGTFFLMTLVLVSLWLSGLVMYFLPTDALSEMSEGEISFRRISVISHGVASWFCCVMLGRALWPHARAMWSRRSDQLKWLLGFVNLTHLLFLTLGGLVLLYGSPLTHDLLSPLHFWAGALFPLIYLTHTWRRFI